MHNVKEPRLGKLAHAHDFKEYYAELRMTQGGWFHKDQTPPVVEPPESCEWVKSPTESRVSLSA